MRKVGNMFNYSVYRTAQGGLSFGCGAVSFDKQTVEEFIAEEKKRRAILMNTSYNKVSRVLRERDILVSNVDLPLLEKFLGKDPVKKVVKKAAPKKAAKKAAPKKTAKKKQYA